MATENREKRAKKMIFFGKTERNLGKGAGLSDVFSLCLCFCASDLIGPMFQRVLSRFIFEERSLQTA
jgi:hypothetical protein